MYENIEKGIIYKEVDRAARRGDRVRIVNATHSYGKYKNGDEFVIKTLPLTGGTVQVEGVSTSALADNPVGLISRKEYVVLEPIGYIYSSKPDKETSTDLEQSLKELREEINVLKRGSFKTNKFIESILHLQSRQLQIDILTNTHQKMSSPREEESIKDDISKTKRKRTEQNKNVKPGDKIRIVDVSGDVKQYKNGDILTVVKNPFYGRFSSGKFVAVEEIPAFISLHEFEKAEDITSVDMGASNNNNLVASNKARVEVINRAKDYVKHVEFLLAEGEYKFTEEEDKVHRECTVDYSVDSDCKTVLVWVRRKLDPVTYVAGVSFASPDEVFNEHIGKAQALEDALNVRNSWFENVPQPDSVVENTLVLYRSSADSVLKTYATNKPHESRMNVQRLNDSSTNMLIKILDDTDAIYE